MRYEQFVRNRSQHHWKNWLILAIVLAVVGVMAFRTVQFYRTIFTLKSMHVDSIREVRISYHPGTPILLRVFPPETILDDLLTSLQDMRTYLTNSQKVLSTDYEWFLEIETTRGQHIQISCSIRSDNTLVHGRLGRFSGTSTFPYGKFRSEGLFQWYQQYNYRWLGDQQQEDGFSLEATE